MKSMKKILALVLALMLFLMIPVEAVAAGAVTAEDYIANLYARAKAAAEEAETAKKEAKLAANHAKNLAAQVVKLKETPGYREDPKYLSYVKAANDAKAEADKAAKVAASKVAAAEAAKAKADAAAKEVVGTTFKVDGVQYWYAPDGGTVAGFMPKNPDQAYPLYVVYLSTELTNGVLICIQDEEIMDFIKGHAKDMTVSAIAEGVGWALDSKYAEKIVEFVLSFSLWALDQAKIDSMIKACNQSKDKKIMMTQWCSPPYNLPFELFAPWEGDYVDDTYFGAQGCIPGTPRIFTPGDYGPYNQYK